MPIPLLYAISFNHCKTTITVGGKKVVVDKTGKDTIVTPKNENSHDTGGDALKGKKTKKEAKT